MTTRDLLILLLSAATLPAVPLAADAGRADARRPAAWRTSPARRAASPVARPRPAAKRSRYFRADGSPRAGTVIRVIPDEGMIDGQYAWAAPDGTRPPDPSYLPSIVPSERNVGLRQRWVVTTTGTAFWVAVGTMPDGSRPRSGPPRPDPAAAATRGPSASNQVFAQWHERVRRGHGDRVAPEQVFAQWHERVRRGHGDGGAR